MYSTTLLASKSISVFFWNILDKFFLIMLGCTPHVLDILVGTIKNNKKCVKLLIKLIH